jgi:hypothetical protein
MTQAELARSRLKHMQQHPYCFLFKLQTSEETPLMQYLGAAEAYVSKLYA